MSVIHQMLKKLDERGAQAGTAVGAGLDRTQARGAAWRLPVIVAAGGAAIAFTALAEWPSPRIEGPVPVPPMVAGAPVDAAASGPAPAQPTAAAPQALEPVGPGLAHQHATRSPRAEPVEAAPPANRPVRAEITDAPLVDAPLLAPPLPARIDKRAAAQTPAQRAAALHRAASELAQSGQRRAALDKALEALVADPAHSASRQLAAVLEHEAGASERAVGLLREGLALDPRDGAQALLLARIQIAQGDAAGALATLDQHAVAGADADGLRGGILAQQGDYKRALGAYESAARAQPANSMWWFGLGVALDSEGQPQRARQAYSRAQSLGLAREDLASFVDQRLRAND